MRNVRHALLSGRCDWCRRIWTGKEWVPERRPEGREIYNHGICRECLGVHFPSSPLQEAAHAARFRFGPILLGR